MSTNPKRPAVVLFDVIERLFDIQPLEEKLMAAGLPGRSLQVWFARVLRDAFALEIAGEYKSFAEVASATLAALMREHQVEPNRSAIADTVQSFAELSAHSDVEPAFQQLADADIRVAALTNGSAETTKKMFRNAKLDQFIERYISIDEVKHWKPAHEVYLYAARALDVNPEQIALISGHDWDVHGAKCAGFVTGFLQRKAAFSKAMGAPDVSASDLQQLADELLRLS
jgi:2-haloacid dehalogenase